MDIVSLQKKYLANTYSPYPISLELGNGSLITDTDGRTYIDLGSGIGASVLGIGNSGWVETVTKQLKKLQHSSNLYCTESCARLAQALCQKSAMEKVFFCNSGAEANECAIKVARKYAAEQKGDDYYTVITLSGSFHGRTLTTLAATGQPRFHQHFQPLTPGFFHVPPNDVQALSLAIEKQKPAAVMLECIQGERGVLPLTGAYIRAAEQLCRKADIPLIIDEVQTGAGRTGKLFSYMHFGISPDIVTTAKGLGGGLPIGACLMSNKLQDVLRPGDHGSTFGGNPVACAGALYVLSRLTPEFLRQVQRKGALLRRTLTGMPGILEVTGMGLMAGLKTHIPCRQVAEACLENGVLVLTAGDRVRLLPPLNIPDRLLLQALEILKTVCKQ